MTADEKAGNGAIIAERAAVAGRPVGAVAAGPAAPNRCVRVA